MWINLITLITTTIPFKNRTWLAKFIITKITQKKQLPRNLVRLQSTETTPFSPRTSWGNKAWLETKIATRAALRYRDEIPAKSCRKIHYFRSVSTKAFKPIETLMPWKKRDLNYWGLVNWRIQRHWGLSSESERASLATEANELSEIFVRCLK